MSAAGSRPARPASVWGQRGRIAQREMGGVRARHHRKRWDRVAASVTAFPAGEDDLLVRHQRHRQKDEAEDQRRVVDARLQCTVRVALERLRMRVRMRLRMRVRMRARMRPRMRPRTRPRMRPRTRVQVRSRGLGGAG
eukprot:4873721-Prymnesium_polylepis.1